MDFKRLEPLLWALGLPMLLAGYDQLADYGAGSPGNLDDAARALGLPGKAGLDGSDVAGLYAAGELDAIRRYCARDVLATALVWARWELLTGRASEARTARREEWIRGEIASGRWSVEVSA